MSLVTKLSDAAYCGYVIGQAVECRRHWMDRAREANRAIVRELRSLRQAVQS